MRSAFYLILQFVNITFVLFASYYINTLHNRVEFLESQFTLISTKQNKGVSNSITEGEEIIESNDIAKPINNINLIQTTIESNSENTAPDQLHGKLGLRPDGTPGYQLGPVPPLLNSDQMANELARNGGFNVRLSNSLSLDRPIKDLRDEVCKTEKYDYSKFKDFKASILITFVDEPLSTLFRSLHSIFNRTPKELLHEIVLVDDGSTAKWLGRELDDYLKLLPNKIKLIRLKERHGVVKARLTAAQNSTGNILIVLDSHIEAQPQWIEPLLDALSKKKNIIVTPQIDSILADSFEYTNREGIGCYLNFKWTMVENSFLSSPVTTTNLIKTPVIAGGLWAVHKDFFFNIGSYDNEFDNWGAEHLELSFRTWLCHGEVYCAPCSRVSHVFRKHGNGYNVNLESIWKNRLRTAVNWLDEYAEIVEAYNYHPGLELGKFDNIIELKNKLQCKNFEWYLNNVSNDYNQPIHSKEDILSLGEIRNFNYNQYCLDLMGSKENQSNINIYHCYTNPNDRGRGQQGFMLLTRVQQIRLIHLWVTDHEALCFIAPNIVVNCNNHIHKWTFVIATVDDNNSVTLDNNNLKYGNKNTIKIIWDNKLCLDTILNKFNQYIMSLNTCNKNSLSQLWIVEGFPNHKWVRPDTNARISNNEFTFNDENFEQNSMDINEMKKDEINDEMNHVNNENKSEL